MILFKVNSKSLSVNPSSITHSKKKIQNEDRTVDGTTVVDIIAVKDVVNVEWAMLDREDFQRILQETQETGFCTIDYWDEKTTGVSTMKNITAVPGGITYEQYYDYRRDKIIWKNVKVSFTER